MQIHSAVCRNGIALVRTVLCIVPCDGLTGIVDLVLVAVVLVITNIVAKFLNVSFRIREHCVGADKELIVLLIQTVDVISTVVSTVHNQLDFLIPEDVQFTDQFSDCFDIGDVMILNHLKEDGKLIRTGSRRSGQWVLLGNHDVTGEPGHCKYDESLFVSVGYYKKIKAYNLNIIMMHFSKL